MSKDLLVSVIVPVYKAEQYLHYCVDSILVQTYKNIEVILVDDGSPDLSGSICDIYAEKDERVRVIHKQNGGVSDARNAGIEDAKGDYIMFVDNDDLVSMTGIESMVAAALEYGSEIIQGLFQKVNNYNIPYKMDNNVSISIIDPESFVETSKENRRVFVWAKMYKTFLAKRYKFPIGHCVEDIYWNGMILTDDDLRSIACVSTTVYYYMQNNESVSHNYTKAQWIDIENTLYDLQLSVKNKTKSSKFQNSYLLLYLSQTFSVKYNLIIRNYYSDFPLGQ